MAHDELGDRMKDYESVPRIGLTKRTPVILRVDGKAFHTFTKGMTRPYDEKFNRCMWAAAAYMCKNIQGAKLAYVQSDEISILITDWETLKTEGWYGYEVQKMASVSASMAATSFLAQYVHEFTDDVIEVKKLPAFDSRVFNLPKEEVANYFIWRQQDATRNSIQSLAQSNFSHKELHGLSCNELQELLFQKKGLNWNDCPVKQKRGVCVVKTSYNVQTKTGLFGSTDPAEQYSEYVRRLKWVPDEEIPIFTQDRAYIDNHLIIKAAE